MEAADGYRRRCAELRRAATLERWTRDALAARLRALLGEPPPPPSSQPTPPPPPAAAGGAAEAARGGGPSPGGGGGAQAAAAAGEPAGEGGAGEGGDGGDGGLGVLCGLVPETLWPRSEREREGGGGEW